MLATELVRLNVDVIVAGGSTSTGAAKKATNKIPIVTAQVNDPVGSGLVASLARPGGNLTGLSTLVPEISGKRLEILKEVLPKLSRVVVLGDSTAPGNAQSVKETELAAKPFDIQINYQDIVGPKRIEMSFREALRDVPMQFCCLERQSLFLSELRLQTLRQTTAFQRYTRRRNMWMSED